jgi:dihydrofolate reductase
VQIVVTESGQLPFDTCVLFSEPTLRVIVVTARRSVKTVESKVGRRPWIRVLDAGEPLSLRRALLTLRQDGIAVVSALGGRRVASTLLAEGLVTDLYLTSSDVDQAEPSRDIHDGPPVLQRRVVAKVGRRGDARARFEHLVAPSTHPWRTQSPSFGR